MNINPLQPHIDVSAIPFDKLAGDPNVPQADKVKEASRQFEAILVRQILTEARKNVISDGEEQSNEKDVYNDMINNQLAQSISKSDSLGLARTLDKQLIHQTVGDHSSGVNATAPSISTTH